MDFGGRQSLGGTQGRGPDWVSNTELLPSPGRGGGVNRQNGGFSTEGTRAPSFSFLLCFHFPSLRSFRKVMSVENDSAMHASYSSIPTDPSLTVLKLSNCAWCFQDPVYNGWFWKSGNVGGFAQSPTHPFAAMPRLRETPSLVCEYRPGLSLAALEGFGSVQNQAISSLRSSVCVHNRGSFPPIGFCPSGFLR